MIRAILLDLGKVIVPFDFTIGYRALQQHSDLTVEELRERIRETGLVPRFESGLIEPRNFVRELCAALSVPLNYAEFCDIWSSIFSRETLISDAFLTQLHRRYPLILVSNTNAIHFEMIRREYPVLRHFDRCIVSYEVGAMKPSPSIYRAAIEAAGCLPEECFFTDDIPDYVEGARRMGIDAVQFHNAAQLENELRGRGIEWSD
jgi:FMN phosphatase YigB (HAD superfamily)